jgi:uncharacterized protein (DUF169 family)
MKNSGRKDYNQAGKGTQGGNRIKGRKNAFLFGACAKRAGIMRVGGACGARHAGRGVCYAFSFQMGDVPMNTATMWKELEETISVLVQPGRRPVAVSFRESEPAEVKKFEGTEPSGCSFWRLAAEGRTFYTVPENHFNCAVGAYTHNIALSQERAEETEQTLKMMFELGYLKPQEVPQIPRLEKEPRAIVYSPLGDAPVEPDVVLFAVKPAGAMLLQEAANRAGVGSGTPALGRPTCMALPASLQHGTITSLGCIGNRVYTGLAEEEMYVVVRGKDLASVAEALITIASANFALQDYAKGRREQLATL